MVTLANIPIVQEWARNRDLRQPIPQVPITPPQIVSEIRYFDVPLSGRYLRVAPNYCVVMPQAAGPPKVYKQGEHYINLDPGLYPIQYVDLHTQDFFLVVIAKSQDAWDVRLKLQIFWQVHLPVEIVSLRDPVGLLKANCRAAVSDYIRSKQHDHLTTAPGVAHLSGEQIGRGIQQMLQRRSALQPFQILEIAVLERDGDSRRNQAVLEASVEATRQEQQRHIQHARTQSEIEKLQQQQKLAAEEQSLALMKAETERRTAEEQARFQLTQAQIEARRAQILRAAEQQAIELRREDNAQQLQQERTLKEMDVRGTLLGGFLEVVGRAQERPGMQMGFDRSSYPQYFADTIRALSADLGEAARPTAPPRPIPAPETLSERLHRELREVNALPSNPQGRLLNGNGNLRVIIKKDAIQLTIFYDEAHPEIAPLVMLKVKDGREVKIPQEYWADAGTIKEIYLTIIGLLRSMPTTPPLRVNGNAAHSVKMEPAPEFQA